MIHNPYYWWCDACKDNVDIFTFPGDGVYCITCGSRTRKPDNRPDPKVIIEDPADEDDELPVDDIVIEKDDDT